MSQTEQSFEAGIFHPDLGNEVAAGRIFFNQWNMRFQSETISLEIPIANLTVELGEGGDERIYFSNSAHPGIRIYTTDESILNHRTFQNSQMREQLETVASRQEIFRRLRILLYFFAGCFLLTWLGVGATSLMVQALARRVPQTWLQNFGDEKIKSMEDENSLADDANRLAALKALAAPLLRVIPSGTNEFKFHIMNNETPNAFALPGGQVVVTTGMLSLVDDPDELLGVLAHEIAHVTQRHHVRTLISAAGPIVIFGVFLHSRSSLFNLLSEGSGLLVLEGFSQEYESEADSVGWKYLVAANIDPRGMINLFRKLETYKGKEKVESKVMQAFSSHPALEKRIDRLESKWKRLSHKSGFIKLDSTDWKLLKAGS